MKFSSINVVQTNSLVPLSQSVPVPPFPFPKTNLIAYWMKRGICGCDAHHGVRAPLPCGPGQLKDVKAALVANLGAYAVRRLRHGMPVKRELVVLFHKYVQRPVLRVPGVLDLRLPADRRHVEQHLEPGGHLYLARAGGLAGRRPRGRTALPARLPEVPRHIAPHPPPPSLGLVLDGRLASPLAASPLRGGPGSAPMPTALLVPCVVDYSSLAPGTKRGAPYSSVH